MELSYEGINEAYADIVTRFYNGKFDAPTTVCPSRDGEVTTIEEPVTIVYRNPLDRVLIDPVRDCNPFFHLFESVWMLAGSNRLRPLTFFNSQMERFSDDGETLNGAYGYRWRTGGGTELLEAVQRADFRSVDQIEHVAQYLSDDAHGRRAVIQMWNAWDDLLRVDDRFGSYSKDVCCNTAAYFRIVEGSFGPELDMTVTNRSNDAVLGMLGANYVHFSILQEYLALSIGVEVGRYYQFTNNLHVYNHHRSLEELVDSPYLGQSVPDNCGENLVRCSLFYTGGKEKFDSRILDIVVGITDCLTQNDVVDFLYSSRIPEDSYGHQLFVDGVLLPMLSAFSKHRQREYSLAYDHLDNVIDTYWKYVGVNWIRKREAVWNSKQK